MPSKRLAGSRETVRALAGLLVEPLTVLDSVERRKARLLATLLLCVLGLGLTSAVVQALVVPNFHSTLAAMGFALVVLCFAYAGSRTRLYRVSAALAATTPALACVAVGVRTPEDHVWYGFILIAVILASLFFSVRTAAFVAAAIFVTLCLLPVWVVELRSPGRLVPLLALHAVLSPLLLVAASHQLSIERENQSELGRMDVRLAQVERLEALARTAGTAAHDLNNMLAVIDANLAALNTERRDAPSQALSEIRMAVTRAAALGRRLLTSAREAALRPSSLDVADTVRNFEPLLRRLAPLPVRLVVHVDSALPHVEMHPLQLEQILMNLVSNARDAMPRGGTLAIQCEHVAIDLRGLPDHPGVRQGRYVRVSVTDSGVGMDSRALSRAFEPYFTTKTEDRGTGLGLAIVREIVTEASGHVTVKSEPGNGSTFSVYLPVRNDAQDSRNLAARGRTGDASRPGPNHSR